MRIGLDARFLTHPQPGGFKTYSVNLVQALVELESPHEFVIYIDRDGQEDLLPPRRRHVRYRALPARVPLLGMAMREQWQLRRAAAEDQLDLIHFLCNTATVGLTLPHVITLHDRLQLAPPRLVRGSGQRSLKLWAQHTYSRAVIRRVMKTATRVITVSEHERRMMCAECGLTKDRVTVTYEGIASAFRCFDRAERVQARSEIEARFGVTRPFVLAVGYEPRKQIPMLIRATQLLAARNIDIALVVVAADAATRGSLDREAANLGIAERVTVVGGVSIDDMVRLYNAAEIFAFPSEAEGFGLPALEAMSCGTPVLARRATSLPEIVSDGGVLIESAAPHEWADAIAGVHAAPDVRRGLRERGLRRARAFSWHRCATQTLAVYQAAVSGARDRAVS